MQNLQHSALKHPISLCLRYPQSNSQSERSVKTLKEMLEEADDPYKALLSNKNTSAIR